MNIYVEKMDDLLRKIVSGCFPNYRGTKIKISDEVPKRLDSYWEGGSKYSFCFYQLDTGKTFDVHSNHPMFEPGQPRILDELPMNIALVKHTIFQGHDLGITIYLNPKNITPYLEGPTEELPFNEQIVLVATASYKSAFRFEEVNRYFSMSRGEYEEAKQALIRKGMLDKRGAITPAGRNVRERLSGRNLYDLKPSTSHTKHVR